MARSRLTRIAVTCVWLDRWMFQKVRAFYEEQHSKMTYAFVESMEKKYLGFDHFTMVTK